MRSIESVGSINKRDIHVELHPFDQLVMIIAECESIIPMHFKSQDPMNLRTSHSLKPVIFENTTHKITGYWGYGIS